MLLNHSVKKTGGVDFKTDMLTLAPHWRLPVYCDCALLCLLWCSRQCLIVGWHTCHSCGQSPCCRHSCGCCLRFRSGSHLELCLIIGVSYLNHTCWKYVIARTESLWCSCCKQLKKVAIFNWTLGTMLEYWKISPKTGGIQYWDNY